jgi:hypothetical protein
VTAGARDRSIGMAERELSAMDYLIRKRATLMQAFDIQRGYTRLRRATVARSALDVIAMIFLLCGLAFWGVAFWQLFTPPAPLSLLSIQAIVLAIVFALAAPLFLSMLIPTTPAGQLLQKTQWRTLGFPVIIACAVYLIYQAERLIELWLFAQPAIAESGLAHPMAISLTIAFVVVPALAWIQLTPERWLEQIEQAHAVRKLEIMQNSEIAVLKTRMIWLKQRVAMDYANMLPTEKTEVLETLRALFMSIGDTQRSIAGTLGITSEIERTMQGDSQIADQLDRVANALTAEWVDVPALASAPAHVDSRLEPQISAPAPAPTQAHTSPHDAAYTRAARDAFGRKPWTLKQLAQELQIGDTSAGALRDRWLESGVVTRANLGRWAFGASEAT